MTYVVICYLVNQLSKYEASAVLFYICLESLFFVFGKFGMDFLLHPKLQ